MTGLTPALLEDFRAMKDIRAITKSDAPVKVKECMKLIASFYGSDDCKKKMKELQFSLISDPLSVRAIKYDAGKLVMGMDETERRIEFDIESSGRDLDRKV